MQRHVKRLAGDGFGDFGDGYRVLTAAAHGVSKPQSDSWPPGLPQDIWYGDLVNNITLNVRRFHLGSEHARSVSFLELVGQPNMVRVAVRGHDTDNIPRPETKTTKRTENVDIIARIATVDQGRLTVFNQNDPVRRRPDDVKHPIGDFIRIDVGGPCHATGSHFPVGDDSGYTVLQRERQVFEGETVPNVVHATDGDAGSMSGRWVLVDRAMMMLSIGDECYNGTSPRRAFTDPIARKTTLLPKLRQACRTGEDSESDDSVDGHRYTTRIRVIRAPKTQDIVAVHGVYVPKPEPIPDPPTVGAWEWRVPNDTGPVETYWDDALCNIYGIAPDQKGDLVGDVGGWLSSIVTGESRAKLKVLADEIVEDPMSSLQIVPFEIMPFQDTSPDTRVRVRSAARSYDDPHEPVVWMRGITQYNPGDDSARVENIKMPDAGNFLQAILEASTAPIAAIDTVRWTIYLYSRSWHRLGLSRASTEYFPLGLHEDDVERVTTKLEDAANHPNQAREPFLARLALANGERPYCLFRPCGVTATKNDERYAILQVVNA